MPSRILLSTFPSLFIFQNHKYDRSRHASLKALTRSFSGVVLTPEYVESRYANAGQTHYKKYFHKSWREGVRHRAKRLFLGLPLARAVRLSYQRTYSLHEPRVLAIYSSPSLTEIVVLPKLRKKRDLQL